MQGRFVCLIPLILTLYACGDSGDGEVTPAPVAFTAFSNVQPGQTVTMNGQSQTQNVVQNTTGVVTQQVVNFPDLNGVGALLAFAPSSPLALTGIQFVSPRAGAGVMWQNGRGSQIVSCGVQTCTASGDGANGVLVNALGSLAWNFQTLGYWLAVTGLTANIAASISAGNATAASSMPLSGTATYSGISGGLYVDAAGALQELAAPMSAVVDFDPFTRTINFSTALTTIRPWTSSGMPTLATQLNMSGQLTYAVGTNRFTGSIAGPGSTPTIVGTVTGVFYGPGAEEIGGTYSVTSNSSQLESMTGSFGGKR